MPHEDTPTTGTIPGAPGGYSEQDFQGGQTATGKPLGVPPSVFDPATGQDVPFSVRRLRRPQTDPTGERFGHINVEPRFFTGDEWRFFDMPLEDRERWLDRLDSTGFLTAYSLSRPATRDETAVVWGNFLSYANQAGARSAEEALKWWHIDKAQNPALRELIAKGGERDAPRPPAPEDIRLDLETVLKKRLGRAPADLVEPMVSAYAAAHTGAGTEGALPPSVEGFVDARVGGSAEAGGFEFAQRVQDFFQMLGGPVKSPTPTGANF